jgi:hypothetical protein
MVFAQKLSDVAASKVLKSGLYPEATVHSLRSSFRDWCGDIIPTSQKKYAKLP